jgi:hypothetical protein
MNLKRAVNFRASLFAAAASLAIAGAAHAQTPSAAVAPAPASQPATGEPSTVVDQVVVTASRVNILGVAETASQGVITAKELSLRPVYRPGQLLETTPGLVVTAHSGEGKANQYLVRGFNLDHGTDIANFIDDMPINRPTNAHGQGYSDVNFFIPEVASGLDYTKGPYYASVGDFGAVASTHLKLVDFLPNQVAASVGTLGVYNVFAGGTHQFSDDDRLMGAAYYGHVDGPWTHPDNFRKYTGILRYSHGTDSEGWNVTAMYLKDDGNFTTDQPLRAVQEGLISRFGTLDPTDGNSSERWSLSSHYAHNTENWRFRVSGYFINSKMVLWNDFTHFLTDPVNGDQEQQDESRNAFGGQASATWEQEFGDITNETVFGLQTRHDDAQIDRKHTFQRNVLDYCELLQADGSYLKSAAINGSCNADRVNLTDIGAYVEDTTRFTHWLRTVVGLREEYYAATDHSLVTGFQGSQNQTLFQPKGSLILGPFHQTEFYLSAGRGFHSDDVRGVFGTVPIEGVPLLAGKTPLMAPAVGEELGVRTNIVPKVQLQVALFQEDFKSELAYDAEAGQDMASAPSRRQGVEFSGQYRPFRWIELNTDLAFSRPRYQGSPALLTSYGLNGPYIADAPNFIGSFGMLIDNLGPWFGGLQWRDLGSSPLSDGNKRPIDTGYREFNADVGYNVNAHLKIQATAFNLLNSKDDASAYYYTSRLQGEPAAGVLGYQFHPLEPLSGNVKVTWLF